MNCLLLLATTAVPTVPYSETPDPAARRFEVQVFRTMRSAERDEQYRLANDAQLYILRVGEFMTSPDRGRVAFSAGLLMQTSSHASVRHEMAGLFGDLLLDRDALAGIGPLLDFVADAPAYDAELYKRAKLGPPTGTYGGSLRVILGTLASVRPAVRIPGKPR